MPVNHATRVRAQDVRTFLFHSLECNRALIRPPYTERSGPRRPPRQSWISLAVVPGGRNSALIFEAAPPPPLLRRAPNSSSPPHCSLLLYLAPGGLPASASTLRGSEAPRSPICNPDQSGPRVPSASDNLAMRSTEVVLEGRIAPQMRCGSCSWRGGVHLTLTDRMAERFPLRKRFGPIQ